MNYPVKFGICVVIGLAGFYLVMARINIELLITGFLLVAAAVACGHYFWARWRQPKNRFEPEIELLSKMGAENLKKQDEDEKIR